jgi:putative glutathione S-transferase
MATSRDTTEQSDPAKFKLEADGSFKRPDTVFRNLIENGGRFEPQASEEHFHLTRY